MQHREKKIAGNNPRAVVIEALDARSLLSAAPVASQSEILVNVQGAKGLRALEAYLVSHSDSVVDRYVDVYASKQLFGSKANSTLQLKLQTGVNPTKAVKVLKQLPGVNWASPNYVYGGTGEFTPNDTLFSTQTTQLNLMQVPQAWDSTTGSSSLTVAVADDGMDYTHEDLQNVIYTNAGEIAGNSIDDDNNGFIDDVHGWDFVNNDNDVYPALNTDFNFRDSHGTAVAGIIGAVSNNAKGVAGLAGGGVKLLPVKFYGFDGFATSSSLSQAIAYVAARGVKLMNISFSIDPFMFDPAFATAYNAFYNQGGLWLNSAGNNNVANPPRQNIQQALFVSNTADTDIKYSSSNYGFGMDISAPGVEVSTTDTGNGYTNATGTSFSTANVTGIAALIWSAHPTWTRDQVAAQLVGTTDNIDAQNPTYLGQLGSGRVNAFKAVAGPLAAPQIRGSVSLPAENGTFAGTLTSFTLDVKNVFNPATVIASNFELRAAGADGLFNTSDDVVASLTLSEAYGIGTNRLTFNTTTTLPAGKYRLTAKSTLADPFGTALDGNADGTAGDDWVRNFNIQGAAPNAPSNLQVVASAYSGSEAVLTWTDNSNDETGFVIERSVSSTFATIDATRNAAANTGYYYDWGLTQAGTTYYYRIRAISAEGASDNSPTASFATEGGQPGIPNAPTNLVAGPGSNATEAALTWKDNSTNETSFVIEQSLTSNFATLSKTITAGFNTTLYWDWGLNPTTTYYYRVVAVNGTDRSTPSNTVQVGSGSTTAPAAPTSLTATAGATSTTANLAWLDNSSDETGFVIERSTSSTFATIQATINAAANATTVSDTGLTPGTTYYYRVTAVNGTVSSTPSNTATFAVADVPPIAPTSLTATAGATSTTANLAWVDNSTNETGFVIERSTSSTFSTIQATINIAANTTTYSDTGLAVATTYYYRVTAVKGALSSTASNTATFIVGDVAPTAPTSLTATAGATSTTANLAWIDNSTTETGFVLERSTSSTFATIQSTINIAANTTTYSDTGLAVATTYYYRVTAVKGALSSTASNTATFVVADVPPNAPSALTATAGATSTTANLSWVDNSTNETGFVLERSTSSTFATIQATINIAANTTTYSDTGLSVATTYYYRVKAVKGTLASTVSNTATFAVADVPPTAPTALTAVAGANTTSINLAWTDNSSNETGFVLERSTSSTFATIQSTINIAANTTTYSDTGLSLGTQYYYRVSAAKGTLVSTPSNTATFTTPSLPTAPSGLTVTLSGTTGAHLAWADNSNNETGFEVQYATDSGFTTGLITATTAANVMAYDATSLTAGTTYYFRVRAVNAAGPSAYTATSQLAIPATGVTVGNASFETPTTTTYIYNPTGGTWTFNVASGIQRNGSAWGAATAPNGVQTAFIQGTTSSLGSISQSITFTAGQYTISFQAARRSGQIQPLKFMVDGKQIGATIAPTANTFSIYTTVAFTVPAGAHTISFAATDNTGDKSTFIDAVTVNSVPATAPSAPTALTATAVSGTPTSAVLAWTDNSFTETGFVLERSTSSTFATIQATVNLGQNVTTTTVTGLSTGTTYYFRVKAVNGSLASAVSATATYTVPAVPTAPSALVAKTGTASTSAVLTWTDNSTNETGFIVQRSTSSTFATISGTFTVAANIKTYTDTGLTNGTTYYYRVLATNGGVLSTASNVVTYVGLAAPSLTVTSPGLGGGTKLTLNWTNVTGETSYEIQRSTSSSFSSVTTLTSAADTSSLVNTGLSTFTTYYYRIRAVNANGTSAWSTTASGRVYF